MLQVYLDGLYCLRSVNIYCKRFISHCASFCLMPTGRARTLPTSDVGLSYWLNRVYRFCLSTIRGQLVYSRHGHGHLTAISARVLSHYADSGHRPLVFSFLQPRFLGLDAIFEARAPQDQSLRSISSKESQNRSKSMPQSVMSVVRLTRQLEQKSTRLQNCLCLASFHHGKPVGPSRTG